MYQPTSLKKLPSSVQKPILQHCLASYPEEACGAWSQRDDGSWQVHVWDNEAPLASRSKQFWVSPTEVLSLLKEQDQGRLMLQGFFHSHPDAPPTLSLQDMEALVWEQQPTYPGISILVVSISPPASPSTTLYEWTE